MVTLRHLRQPIQSARSLYRKVRLAGLRREEEQRTRQIRRLHRSACWCGGGLQPFRWHASYAVCRECRSYVNIVPPDPQELRDLYSFDAYWHTRQQIKGSPPIEGRTANDQSDGRITYWLDLIARFGPPTGRVIEVGCAHGVLLAELQKRHYECIGVEPDEKTAQWVRQNVGLDVRSGLFPDLDLPPGDLFLAFDVVEHSPDPEGFLKGIAQLLRPGGTAILQTPIDRYDFEPPFGEKFSAAFDDVEHLFLFTNLALERLAEQAGLTIVSNDERLWLHHEICVLQKPAA